MYSQRLAREERLTAASQDFLIDLFRSPDPFAPADSERGSGITVVEALDIGRQRIDDELANQPKLRASLLRTISEVYDSLDQDREAVAMREEALALERELFGEASAQVVASLQALGDMYRNRGEPGKAGRYMQRQLALARQIFPENSPQMGLAEVRAGIHANQSGRLREGRRLLDSGIAKLRPERIAYARELIAALIAFSENQGTELSDDAFRAIAEAEQIAVDAYGKTSLQAANVQIRLASSLTMIGDYQGSERNFQEALPILEERLGKDHGSSLSALNNLGYLYTRSGEYAKAEAIFRELVDRQLRIYGSQSKSVADSYQNLASTLAKLGRFDEALPLHRTAYETFKAVLNDDNYAIAFPLLSIAYAELQQDHPAAAERAATEALQRFRRTVPDTFLEGVARCLVGLSLERQGRAEEGAALVLESHRLLSTGSVPAPYPKLCRMPAG
jgi:tetratricopeptide (TPR) repeat protein